MELEIINEHKENIIQKFSDRFKKNNFIEKKPEKLIPSSDQTIIFTNSSIVLFKDILTNKNKDKNDYFVIQPCLRLKHLKNIASLDFRIPRMSLFKMLGGFSKKPTDLIFSMCIKFLISDLNIKKKDLKIVCSEKKYNYWNSLSTQHGLTTEIAEEYEWQFGIEGVYGIGIAFGITGEDNKLKYIGNFVEIYQGKKFLGIEFGFGLEPLIGRSLLKKTSFHASSAILIGQKLLKFKPDPALADLISILSAMMSDSNLIKSRRRKSLFLKTIRILSIRMIKQDVSYDLCILWIKNFMFSFFNKTNIYHEEIFHNRYLELIGSDKKLANYVKSQNSLFKSNKKNLLKFLALEDYILYLSKIYFKERSEIIIEFKKYESFYTFLKIKKVSL